MLKDNGCGSRPPILPTISKQGEKQRQNEVWRTPDGEYNRFPVLGLQLSSVQSIQRSATDVLIRRFRGSKNEKAATMWEVHNTALNQDFSCTRKNGGGWCLGRVGVRVHRTKETSVTKAAPKARMSTKTGATCTTSRGGSPFVGAAKTCAEIVFT